MDCGEKNWANDPLEEREPVGFKIVLYEKDDVVAVNLLSTGEWEKTSLAAIQYALARVGPGAIFLDIGANQGWYALHAAAQGAQVYAFEPMAENLALLRSSLCINQHLAPRVTVVPAALGTAKQDDCVLFSSDTNQGDGIMNCSPEFQVPEGYVSRQEGLQVLQLDSLMRDVDDIGVIKMDIEGHEIFAVEGGNYTFFQRKVPYILMDSASSAADIFMPFDK
ncbi:hypothetical protein WJX73_003972 [Symbiochloris irregularis]|uniref:Methyltransferase FkbM domain-containing protein n=1 Tax=Symbiochloris irregularis TaxID=706552 RepID=A0AAW1P5H9_9CHLO